MNKPRIMIMGHTSVGKTTMIRTLVKRPIGKIGSEANVTKNITEEYYEGLQAVFVDTPGFQNAGKLLLYYDLNGDPNKDDSIKYDISAVEALKDSDAVLYLADLSVTPDSSHIDEIKLIKKFQPRIVGVLNKCGSLLKDKDEDTLQRQKSWKDALEINGIKHSIFFDAHFDKPSKIYNIYNSIQKVLSDKKSISFRNGLKLFEERQEKIRNLAFDFLYSMIEDLRQISVTVNGSEHDYIKEKVLKAIQEELGIAIKGVTVKFLEHVSSLYMFVSEHPLDTADEIDHLLETKTRLLQVVKSNVNTAGILGTITAVIGAAIGAIAAGSISGGLGALSGALVGSQWGSISGGAFGVFAGTVISVGDVHTAKLSDNQIQKVFHRCVSVIWGLSNHGYGKTDHISVEQIQKWGEYIADIKQFEMKESWFLVSKNGLFQYFNELISFFENKY